MTLQTTMSPSDHDLIRCTLVHKRRKIWQEFWVTRGQFLLR